ncbi:WD40/YVTN/BNR-like repeat-containing protein [Synoicihabitans lomoniglobus]|uniref:Photosynthesis system II assembly factor Ycf48/Hcf136-like domain-containing protein n=1 Tax=Synoicihabitans lomoniglobus TaxID=2909285 RepID=A0AAF0CRZ2_9BACT|nr:hypothetical protein [Opitutaceae bacterium LMO-M01]WED66948.1 hypothetical protein PXH66_08810 [Opitutaceae bacterium LMO-M01]
MIASNRSIRRLQYFAAALFALATTCSATGATNFSIRHQVSGGATLWGLVEGPDGLVAVGTGGRLLTSEDGKNWQSRETETDAWLTAVTFANGRYVVVGESGVILLSDDLITWRLVADVPTEERLNNIRFGGGRWVAVGERGTIIWSDDAVIWRQSSRLTSKWLRALATSEAVDVDGTRHRIWVTGGQADVRLHSFDGIEWIKDTFSGNGGKDVEAFTPIYSGFGTTSQSEGTFRVHSHEFGAVGSDGFIASYHVISSLDPSGDDPNGIYHGFYFHSLSGSTDDEFKDIDWRAIVRGNGRHFVVGTAGTVLSAPQIYSRSEWTRHHNLPDTTFTAAGFGLDSFFIVGANETIVQSSPSFRGQLANLSARGRIVGAHGSLVAGFVLGGAEETTLLLRGVGPQLTDFGITAPLPAPRIRLQDASTTTLQTNNGWRFSQHLSLATSQTGAFPLPDGSDDSAMLATLAPGAYTLTTNDESGDEGVTLSEIYHVPDREGVFPAAHPINLSTRGRVGAGEDVLVGGFVVEGASAIRVLVRAVGPGLAQFNVGNPLADPTITVQSADGTLIGTNDNWESQAHPGDQTTILNEILETSRVVGAFPLDAHSTDAALLLWLSPGTYTATVSGNPTTSSGGEALFEIYELP